MRAVLTLYLLMVGCWVHSQPIIPVLRPELHGLPSLGPAAFATYVLCDSLMHRYDDLDGVELLLLDSPVQPGYDETMEALVTSSEWVVAGTVVVGRRAYGHQVPRIPSSTLRKLTTSATTAWCEGVKGAGIGERLVYRFAPDSPRLHTIIVVNGSVKDRDAWEACNRVHELLLLENGKAFATPALEDTPDPQSFATGLLGRRVDGAPLELIFEVRSVYQGLHHDDTMITEIHFDGTDVH